MALKRKQLSSRQRHVLTLLAGGTARTTIAEETGYSPSHISRITNSEAAQMALIEMRAQIEAQVVTELPGLVSEALEILKAQLKHPLQPQRAAAAQFILKNLAGPFLQALAKTPAGKDIAGDTFDALIIEGDSQNGTLTSDMEINHATTR